LLYQRGLGLESPHPTWCRGIKEFTHFR
jgi:hypothetical protein